MKKRIIALLSTTGVLGFLGFIRWKKMLEEAAQQEAQARFMEERRRFIRRLDHELKNPLTILRVNLVNLADTDDAEERHRIYDNLQEQVMRLSHLVSGLRKLVMVDNTLTEDSPIDMPFMLGMLVTAMLDHPLAAGKKLLTPQNIYDLPAICGDIDMIQLAIYNVIDNAMKFTGTGDTIRLSTFEQDGSVFIEVADSGRGIPADDLPYIWEELYRSKDVHGIVGSGIGLAMVKTIVELHGGWVEAESQVGSGTTIRLYFPIDQEA